MNNHVSHLTSTQQNTIRIHRGVAFIAAQIPADGRRDIAGQTQELLDRLDHLLTVAGSDRSKVTGATIVLKHFMRDISAVETLWKDWLPEGTRPTRATVEASLAAEETLLEISLQATV